MSENLSLPISLPNQTVSNTDGKTLTFDISESATTSYELIFPATNAVGNLLNDGSGNLSWSTGGGGTSLFADGSNSAPSISFTSDTDTGMYLSADGTIGFAAAGSEVATFTDNVFTFCPNSTTSFQMWGTRDYFKMTALNGQLGPRLVFEHASGTAAPHYIQSNHNGGAAASNYLDFYLWGGSSDGFGLGTHRVMRVGQSADGPNNANITIYGEHFVGDPNIISSNSINTCVSISTK